MKDLRKYIRGILKESFGDSKLISIEEVFDLIEYHDSFKDLYPGYNPEFENEHAEDYYYPSKEKAYEEVGHILSFFINLPNPIPVYRAIQVKSLEDIRYDYLGDSWTYERQSALDFAENHNGGNVLISAMVTKNNVDWKATLKNNFLFSEGTDNFDENEIKVEDTDLLIDVQVEWIKKNINENISDSEVKLNRYVYHASNVSNRDRIEKVGILPYRGVQWFEDTLIKGKAVFATNSENKSDWFDSTWDDDIWRIDTSKIKNVKWFMDPNVDNGVWIYTKSSIPRNAIEMIKVGTGKDLLESHISMDDVQKMQSMHKPSSDIIFGAEPEDKFKEIKIELSNIKAPKNLSLDFYKKKNLDEDVYIVEKLMRLIDSGIEINPIVVDEHNKIMDGLHRYVAHKEMYKYYNGPSQIRVYKRDVFMNESKQNSIFKIPNILGTTNFWHGGNLDSYDDVIAQKNGRYEYGPGLYLTTQFEVAQKYAKGSRKMYLVTVTSGVDINKAILPEQEVINFIKSHIITNKRKEVLERLQKYRVDGGFKAYVFNNIILNEKAIKPSNTSSLRQFYIDNGIDYDMVDNAFGWGEKMMVLYNMKKIVGYTVLKSGEIPEKYNLH